MTPDAQQPEYIITEQQISEIEACQYMTEMALVRFVKTLRTRLHPPAPTLQQHTECYIDGYNDGAEAERERVRIPILAIEKDFEMHFTHWDKEKDPFGNPTFGDGAVIACDRIIESLREQGAQRCK